MTLAFALCNLAGYLVMEGDLAAARSTAREGMRLNRALGDSMNVTMCIEHLALAAALSGDRIRAARLAGYGDAYYRRHGYVRQPA